MVFDRSGRAVGWGTAVLFALALCLTIPHPGCPHPGSVTRLELASEELTTGRWNTQGFRTMLLIFYASEKLGGLAGTQGIGLHLWSF